MTRLIKEWLLFTVWLVLVVWMITHLVGCGGPDVDGADFAWQSPVFGVGQLKGPNQNFFNPDVFDMSAKNIIDGLETTGLSRKRMEWAMQSARVDTIAEDFLWGQHGTLVAGDELDFKLNVSMAYRASGNNELITRCVWKTALMHEMTHLMLAETTGDPDSAHVRPNTWGYSGVQLGDCYEITYLPTTLESVQ
jgi:hypothetical protein